MTIKIKNPFSRIQDPINHDIYERFISAFDPHALSEQIYQDVNDRVMTNLKEIRPDLLVNFNILYQDTSIQIKEIQKISDTIEKKSKKLFESSSLTEDVFKIRDEMKVLKKKLDKLNHGFKSFSKLSVCIEED